MSDSRRTRLSGGRAAGRKLLIAAACAALALGACDTIRPTGPAPEKVPERRSRIDTERSGSLSELFGTGAPVGNTNVRLGSAGGEALTGAPVNRHIWRAAIDTLAFLPIASTDPYSGVIATDWGATAGASDEQVKVTAFVTGVDLSPAALRVAVFRQVRDARGAWVAAPVSAETAERVEDAILTRARQLRLEEESAGRR